MRWTFVQILQTNVTLTSALPIMDFRLKKWKFWKQKLCEAQATEIETLNLNCSYLLSCSVMQCLSYSHPERFQYDFDITLWQFPASLT